jgi:hypothetical protein
MRVLKSFLSITGMVSILSMSPVLAGEASPARVSEIAGAFAGVAESCGLDTEAYSNRVENLLNDMARDAGQAEQLMAGFDSKKKETIAQEESERTIDCMDAKRRFEQLPINQPGWTVETGWASEML